MNGMKQFLRISKNRNGQGMVEYILLLVIVVAVVMAFKGKFTKAVDDKAGKVGEDIQNFKGD